MLKQSYKVTLALVFFSTSAFSYQPENKPDNAWSAISTPAKGAPESIGSYANGCMIGAQSLPASGDGFIDMRRNRNRFYGQPKLIQFIHDLGQFTNNHHGQKHLIGDLSQPRGGRMNFGHSSHQVGLDVDIWMQTTPMDMQINPSRDMKTVISKASGTVNGGALAIPTRDALFFSANHPDVARIFVNPVVKLHLCQTESNTAWLNKLRPWWGHDQHFHVRLKCGANQPKCKSQKPPPPGDGCNNGLYNWVDDQIESIINPKIKKKSGKKRRPKVPPKYCELLLNQ